MPNVPTIKGCHNVKASGVVCKSALPEKQDCDFIKLYMLEKERTRLNKEKKRILLQLESINNRLKDIQKFYEENIGQELNPKQKNIRDDEKTEFKTMSIDY